MTKTIKHVGIIMDGNGRWATKKNRLRSFGHKKGAENLEKLLPHIFNKGIKYVSLYAFSIENFKRDEKEVTFLMNLFVEMFSKKGETFIKNKTRVVFSGRRDNLKKDVLEAMDSIMAKTKDFENTVNFCINYGGRQEILDAIIKVKLDGKEELTEEQFNKYLYNDLPPLDLVIRTSGEYRISNFMLWQSSYAEYYFTSVLFPDFDKKELDKAIDDYYNRNRRFGG